MKPERWACIERLYFAALELDESQRSEFLEGGCRGDEVLRCEVEPLLATANISDAFLQVNALELEARALARDHDRLLPTAGDLTGRKVGPYTLLRRIGAGGMGVVYEAEQQQPRRTVALKVIRSGLADPELLRRFEQESQALGRLRHPGIAQIYEAGTADSGFELQPYFAMELIRGELLLGYAETRQLNTRQRLEIMAQICEAVHHAHQRGLIHRDLKPANILVEENGQPKILDFGVARVTDSDAQATRQTEMGQIVGTLAYMSPEQVLGDPLELDTRSDVYSLGMIVFELLSGRLPYTISGQLHETVQTILEEEPIRLGLISRTYRGDVESIVAKALEKDKNRRYASAEGMAGDLRRYLNEEPILARPPSTAYRLQKFARRHKALIGAVMAVFLVLVAGVIASAWEAARARRAEQVAITEAATAKAINDFLQNDLLAQASTHMQARPDIRPDPNLKVRTALDRTAGRITGKFEKQPVVEASIRQTIGNTYRDLGLYPEGQRQLERALDLRCRVLGQQHPDTLQTMDNLAELYRLQSKYTQAEPLFIKVLAEKRRVLGQQHPDTLQTTDNLAALYLNQGKYAQAEPLITRVLEVQRRVLGEEHPNTLYTMDGLALLYLYQGKYTQAEPLFIKALAALRRVLGDEHPDTLDTINGLALLYLHQGKYAQAELLSIKALTGQRRVLGEEHPDTLYTEYGLALLYLNQGKYAQAEPLITRVLEVQRRVLGEEHPNTLLSMDGLALLWTHQGKYAKAESLYTKVLDIQRRVLGAEHPRRLTITNDLTLLYLYQRKYAEAETLLRKALNSYEKIMSNTWDRYSCQTLLGVSLAGQKRYAEAEGLLLSGYQGMLERQATIPAGSRFQVGKAREWIVQLYRDWGKPERIGGLFRKQPFSLPIGSRH